MTQHESSNRMTPRQRNGNVARDEAADSFIEKRRAILAERARLMPDLAAREEFLSKHVFIHTHVEKSAGTTLTYGLANIVGWTHTVDTRMTPSLPAVRMNRAMTATVRLYTGHFPWGVHRRFSQTALYVAAVRDPVERAVSFYRYVRASDEHPAQRFVGKREFEDAIRVFREHGHGIVNDGQARMMAGKALGGKFGAEDLLAHVGRNYFLVVPQHEVDQAIARLRSAFGLPALELGAHNVGRGRTPELATGLRDKIAAWNSIDASLYEWAQRDFSERLDRACEIIQQSCRPNRA